MIKVLYAIAALAVIVGVSAPLLSCIASALRRAAHRWGSLPRASRAVFCLFLCAAVLYGGSKHVTWGPGLHAVREELTDTGGDLAWTTSEANVYFVISNRETTNDVWSAFAETYETEYQFSFANASNWYWKVTAAQIPAQRGITLDRVDIYPDGARLSWHANEDSDLDLTGKEIHVLMCRPDTDNLWREMGTVYGVTNATVNGWFMDGRTLWKVYTNDE